MTYLTSEESGWDGILVRKKTVHHKRFLATDVVWIDIYDPSSSLHLQQLRVDQVVYIDSGSVPLTFLPQEPFDFHDPYGAKFARIGGRGPISSIWLPHSRETEVTLSNHLSVDVEIFIRAWQYSKAEARGVVVK